jgi:hypothetical protein
MPTADAGNLSDLVARCSRDLHRASQQVQAFNFLLFESDKAGVGKSEKPGGNLDQGTRPVASTIGRKKGETVVDTNRPSDEIAPTDSWLSKSMV